MHPAKLRSCAFGWLAIIGLFALWWWFEGNRVRPILDDHFTASPRRLASIAVPTPDWCSYSGNYSNHGNGWPSGLRISRSGVRATTDHHKFRHLVPSRYQGGSHLRYYLAGAGLEHYNLLCFIASRIQTGGTVAEVGAAVGLSGLALACNPRVPMFSYDIVDGRAVAMSELNISGPALQAAHPNAFYVVGNALARDNAKKLFAADAILLDTVHRPYTVPFEIEFFQALQDSCYAGVVICDDIDEHDEMRRWWASIRLKKHVLTDIGHGSGTGVVDFSGRVEIVD